MIELVRRLLSLVWLSAWRAAGEISDQNASHRADQPHTARDRADEGDAHARGEEGQHQRKSEERMQQ